MVLSDRDIKSAIEAGKIKIEPAPDFAAQLGACSLDLRLGSKFLVYKAGGNVVLDPKQPDTLEGITKEVEVAEEEGFVLDPAEFVLATTLERVEIPDDLTGRLEGRSSLGRLGIVIHSTASLIETGFRGQITLELANIGHIPVKLYPEMRVCSLSFEQLSSPAQVPYYKKKGAKFAGQTGPVIC